MLFGDFLISYKNLFCLLLNNCFLDIYRVYGESPFRCLNLPYEDMAEARVGR